MKISVRPISSHEELLDSYRLRFQIYADLPKNEGGLEDLDPADYPFGLEFDQWDAIAVQFGAFEENGKMVGCLRLVPDSQLGFVCEYPNGNGSRFYLPAHIRREHLLEASRMCVLPEYRSQRVMDMLDYRAMEWSAESGYTHWCLTSVASLIEQKQRHNWSLEKFDREKEYHRGKRSGIIINLAETMKNLRQNGRWLGNDQ